MSESIDQRQLHVKLAVKGQDRSNIYEPRRENQAASNEIKLEPKPVSKEVILRLIDFIEQI